MANTQKRIIMPPLCLPPGCPPPCCLPQCCPPQCCPPPCCPSQCCPPPCCPPQCCPPPCCPPQCCPPQCCPPQCCPPQCCPPRCCPPQCCPPCFPQQCCQPPGCPTPPCCPKGPTCPPPPPFCSPPCGPPSSDPCKSKCGCCGGRNTIICVPKGCPPPCCNPCCSPCCNPCCPPCCCCPSPCCNPCDPCCSDKPASFNNCNFYCSELPKGFGANGGCNNFYKNPCCPPTDDCCPHDDCCPPDDFCPPTPNFCSGNNRAAGDDQMAPVPRRDRKPGRNKGGTRGWNSRQRSPYGQSRSPTPYRHHSGCHPYYGEPGYGNDCKGASGSGPIYNEISCRNMSERSSKSFTKSRSGHRHSGHRKNGHRFSKRKSKELKDMIEDFCNESVSGRLAIPQTKSAGQCTSPERTAVRSAGVEARLSEHLECMKWTDGASTPLKITGKGQKTLSKSKQDPHACQKLKSPLQIKIIGTHGDGSEIKRLQIKTIERLVFPVRRGRSTARKRMRDYGQKLDSSTRDDDAKKSSSRSDYKDRQKLPHSEPCPGNLALLECLPEITEKKETPVSTLQLFGPHCPQIASSFMVSLPVTVTPGGDGLTHARSADGRLDKKSSINRRARSFESIRQIEDSYKIIKRESKIPPKTAADCSMEKSLKPIYQTMKNSRIDKIIHQQFCVMTMQIDKSKSKKQPKNPDPVITVPPVSETAPENISNRSENASPLILRNTDRYINDFITSNKERECKLQTPGGNPSPFGRAITSGLDSNSSTPHVSPSWESFPFKYQDNDDGAKFFPKYDYGVTGSPSPTPSSIQHYRCKSRNQANNKHQTKTESTSDNYPESTGITSTKPPTVNNDPPSSSRRPGTYVLDETESFLSTEQKLHKSFKNTSSKNNDPYIKTTTGNTVPSTTHAKCKPPKSARLKIAPPRPPPPMLPRYNTNHQFNRPDSNIKRNDPQNTDTSPAINNHPESEFRYPEINRQYLQSENRLPQINTQPIINYSTVNSFKGGQNSDSNRLPPITSPNTSNPANPYLLNSYPYVQPYAFTMSSSSGSPQSFSINTSSGDPQSYAINTSSGNPQSYPTTTYSGNPQSYPTTTSSGNPEEYSTNSSSWSTQEYSMDNSSGNPQQYSTSYSSGNPQQYSSSYSSRNNGTMFPPIAPPAPPTIIKVVRYSDCCSPCNTALPCTPCPQPCLICRPVSRRCRRKRKCKRRGPRCADCCNVCKCCGCVPCCCCKCETTPFPQLPIRKVSCCIPDPCCRSSCSCCCCDCDCCCDQDCNV